MDFEGIPRKQKAALRAAFLGISGALRNATEGVTGAADRNRTGDLLITNQLLYHLSYSSESGKLYGLLATKGRVLI
jgi:hypothetical protein